jgi:two-component system cell cycle response regulator DivK
MREPAADTDGKDMDAGEQGHTILVVEDNSLMRRLFVRCLEEGGHTVIEAQDPQRVPELMRQGLPDLVMMDILMPGISGVDLIKIIRADPALAGVPVVAVTNLATAADKRRLAEAGFDGHVSKPIRPKEFLSQVAGFLGVAELAKAG